MARTGLKEINNIADPLLAHQFDLFITNLPVGDSKTLAVQIESSQIPSYGTEDVMIRLHGVSKPFAGAAIYEHKMTCTFMESRLLIIRDSIVSWIEYSRSVRNTSGSYNSDYTATADLVLYDDRNNAIRTIRHFGFYPEKIDSVSLSGASGSEVVKYSVTFNYTYFSEQ